MIRTLFFGCVGALALAAMSVHALAGGPAVGVDVDPNAYNAAAPGSLMFSYGGPPIAALANAVAYGWGGPGSSGQPACAGWVVFGTRAGHPDHCPS